MDARERVKRTLEFSSPDRVPRQLWVLPWAVDRYKDEIEAIQKSFPDDIVTSPAFLKTPPLGKGDRYAEGSSTDEWGCTFVNIQKGAIGEVKDPILPDWSRVDEVRIPEERLSVGREEVNAFCRSTDAFVTSPCGPRPFERLQFIRGTENLLLDLMDRPPELELLIHRMQDFYRRELECWARTDVDALFFMDDWGSQDQLLVPPKVWQELFKPLYREYAEIARDHGKYIFMHSDGHILEIVEDLVEIGIDALNSQLFCMGVEEVGRRFKGKITFWGEMDRQYMLTKASEREILDGVKAMKDCLYDKGGLVAQCEFGLAADPGNVRTFLEAWEKV